MGLNLLRLQTKIIKILWSLGLCLFVSIGFSACLATQLTGDDVDEDAITISDLENLPPELVTIQGQQIRQWASEAEASSEYADPEWSATQAIGSPNTERCGDYQTAWATAGSDSKEWLVVRYPVAVHVTGINIIQSFNPSQVVKVELLGAFDRAIEIFNQDPIQIDQPCPFFLPIPIEKTEGRFDALRIWVDQSILGLGWNQIDAVELVGEP
jgi:hypothetical protein